MSFRRLLAATVLQWIPLAVVILLLSGLVYAVGQQGYRQTANDPQIAMATDAVNALRDGSTPENVVPATRIDISRSLAPYVVVYDLTLKVVASSANDKGEPIALPPGVFESAANTSYDAVTWTSPVSGVRSAVVVMSWGGGYVLAGRSLKQVEAREDDLLSIVLAGCVGILAASFVTSFLARLIAARLAA